jgi:NADH-quinone oxidoreductase subunit C
MSQAPGEPGTPAGEPPAVEEDGLPARRDEQPAAAPVVRMGMFGVQDTPDTSGYGLLQVHKRPPVSSEPPYGGELTFHVRRERLVAVCEKLLKEPALRFEIFSGVSGVHYPDDTGRELRAVYHLVSITHNRRLRLEVSAPDGDAHVPSVVSVYPSANWHERETWDFFGIVFDGHPGLTRIEMPDDWRGHPQRKDYPLGGIPVEYRGTKVPPPEERRWYA